MFQIQQSEDIWNQLRYLESSDIVRRNLERFHGNRRFNFTIASQVANNFRQAREYFECASAAPLSVKPLLLYYGVATLSRAVILFLNPSSRESTLSPGHGLTTFQWNAILENDPIDFGKMRVKTNRGLFLDLIQTTKNKTYIKHQSSSLSNVIQVAPLNSGTAIEFEQLVLRLPILKDSFENWKGTSFPYLMINQFDTVNNKIKLLNRESVENSVNIIFKGCESVLNGINYENEITCSAGFDALKCNLIVNGPESAFGISELCLVSSTPFELNEIGNYFALSYYLGMLARYFPSTWMGLSQPKKGDSVFPLLADIIRVVESNFPKQVLNLLNGPYSFETKLEDTTEQEVNDINQS